MAKLRHLLMLACVLALCSLILVEAQDSKGPKKKKSGTKKRKKVNSSTTATADAGSPPPSPPPAPSPHESAGAVPPPPPPPPADAPTSAAEQESPAPAEATAASPPPPPSEEIRHSQPPPNAKVKRPMKTWKRPPSAPVPNAPQQALSLRRLVDKHAPTLKIPTPGGVDIVKQVDYALASVPSMSVFLVFNFVLKFVMRGVLRIPIVPPPLVGMFIFFGYMLSLSEADAAQFVDFFSPGSTMLKNFLPVFFIPGLIFTPVAAQGIRLIDFLKFAAAVITGMGIVLVQTGFLTDYVMKISKTVAPPPAPPDNGAFVPWFSEALERIFGVATAASGLLSLLLPSTLQIYYAMATFFSFIFSARLPRMMPPKVAKFWHPLLTTYLAATALIMLQGILRGRSLLDGLTEYLVPGAMWHKAAGNLIMFFLEPAIVSFSFGLYERKQLLKENAAAILSGSLSSALLGTMTMALIGRITGVPRVLGMAMMPRATAALAVVQAGMIGASTALTTVQCCILGVSGANFGLPILDAVRMQNPIARGVAMGGSGLALAAAALAKDDPAAFPFGTLTMSLTSTFSTILFSFPVFQRLIFWIAGVSRDDVAAIVAPVVEAPPAPKKPWAILRDKVQELRKR